MDRKAMNKLTYGLFVLTVSYDGKLNGCITNTAMQVANDPTRIAIAVNKSNFTRDLVDDCCKFNISVISEDADFSLFERFGFASGRDTDKFADFEDYELSENYIPYITKGTNGFISAEVVKTYDLGSHTLFLATIADGETLSDVSSATYDYYQNNIKPKKAAPAAGKTVWRCKVCGYEYEGENLPADFICPLCKHPASDFEKITG